MRVTDRLVLRPIGPAYLAELAELHADPRVWEHFPAGRHRGVEQTRDWLAQRVREWARDGLGYWTAHLRAEQPGLPADGFVGVGGCARRCEASYWNLYYRFRPTAHGRGLAAELARTALAAVTELGDGAPVLAWVLEHNVASSRTAERAGLRLVWRGPDRADANAVRRVYANRLLSGAEQARILGPAPS